MTKLTEWIPSNIDPVRPGWYEVRFNAASKVTMLRFDRGCWFGAAFFGEEFLSCFGLNGGFPWRDDAEAWRGLAEKPE